MTNPAHSRAVAVGIVLCTTLLSGCASDLFLLPQQTRANACACGGFHPLELPTSLRDLQPESLSVQNGNEARIGAFLFSKSGDYGTLMVSGGNAMGRRDTAGYTAFLQGRGFRVMVFSFQGYDDNDGEASLNSLLGDAEAVHAEIDGRFPGEPVVYLASSISTAPALCLPSQVPDLAGVVLEGSLNVNTIPFRYLGSWWPLLPLFPITLPYVSAISLSVPAELRASRCATNAGDVPALFLHHPQDVTTPYGSAKSLFERYAGPKTFVDFEASHNRLHHLLLRSDAPAQDRVVHTVQDWLARP